MNCTKCNFKLHYGDKFCNNCGEKVEKGAYDEAYKKTVWGKLDKANDVWQTMTLKKFLDHWITKGIILIAVLVWGFFDAYTSLANIRFLESENYTVEYNKKLDEYYIRTEEDIVDLSLYIPRYSEKIKITEHKADKKETRIMLPEEYKKHAVRVKKNEFDYVTISCVRNEKNTDTVKLYVTE